MKQIKDAIGTYEVPTNPYQLKSADSIYLNVWHNTNQSNTNEWKVGMKATDENGKEEKFTAGILNVFEPARWFRNIDTQYREFDFYQDFLHFRADLKKQGLNFEKKPSAGFFYSNNLGHDNPFNTAYAYIFKEKGHDPFVGIRFWDFYWSGYVNENEYKKGMAPDYTAVIIQKEKKGMIDGWA